MKSFINTIESIPTLNNLNISIDKKISILCQISKIQTKYGSKIFVSLVKNAIKSKDLEFIQYITNISISHKKIIIKIIIESECDVTLFYNKDDKMIINVACEFGYINFIKYAIENKYSYDDDAVVYASKGGYLNCIILLINEGCNMTINALNTAIKFEYKDCVKWFLEHKCPCNETTTAIASELGYLDCLILLHTYECPWDCNAVYNATKCGHINCLKYLCKNNCSIADDIIDTISNLNTNYQIDECITYLKQNIFDYNNSFD